MNKAMLIDSQGFTRIEFVSDDPESFIDVPVRTPVNTFHLKAMGSTAERVHIRTFRLKGKMANSIFVYEEDV